jgi:hypothetical protein
MFMMMMIIIIIIIIIIINARKYAPGHPAGLKLDTNTFQWSEQCLHESRK